MPANESSTAKRFLEFIEANKLILPGEKLLLTVSGGMDSTFMLHLYANAGYDFGIAHCNFTLRGKESDDDVIFVEELSKKFGKKMHLKKFDTEKFAEENNYSIQEAARILRYEWFEQLCKEFSYDKIATAHHLDDSIETFFINLMRGTGYAGLKGIKVINGKVIRPLLFATRDEIVNFVRENNINYREDSSNASDDYLRNRIRHHLIPFFKNESEGFEKNMKNLMDEFSLTGKIIESHMDEWKNQNMKTDESGNRLIPLDVISQEQQPEAFLSLLLYTEGITGVDCHKILSVKIPGKIFQSQDTALLVDRNFIIVQKNATQSTKIINVQHLPAEVNVGYMHVSLHEKTTTDVQPFSGSNQLQQIDAGKITMPLTLRTWKEGDYFFPLGMNNRKKLSDFYADEKIDRFQKDKIYLLLSGQDIVCILGHRIDDRYKITPTTRKILTIQTTIQ